MVAIRNMNWSLLLHPAHQMQHAGGQQPAARMCHHAHFAENGMAILQAAFALFFILIVFCAVLNFGLLHYSTCTLQAQIQGALSRLDNTNIAASTDVATALKQYILSDAYALDADRLTVSNASITLQADTQDKTLLRDANWAKTITKQQETAAVKATISYIVPVFAALPGIPDVSITYQLDAHRLTFSQIELVS